MRFFSRFILFYALIVLVLTGAYYYVAAHFFVNSQGEANMWWLVAYLGLVFASALIISMKDEDNGYAGFNYHFITYVIVNCVMVAVILLKSTNGTEKQNLQSLLFMMAFWGMGLLFHLGMYVFMFRKKQIRTYEKDDVFK